ncbi:hypothetical protein pipiens_012462 [Culex pipiens pipiens]|uniref:Fibrinogen C-terminal domain-containing protein n=1 Tax=Culex pipiens pipiens TaxID=38569 RepID=A0ABD1D2D6_CULPP
MTGFREPFQVFCDQEYEGGGWIVIQNRYDGSVHFYRDWSEYERGFGDLEEEMWLGLGKIHELTYSRRYELHVVLEDWEGIRAVARYSDFLVAGPAEKYMLRSLGSFSGNAGDSLREQLGMKFTTFNADNDIHAVNCAVEYYGAWWYTMCHHSNLNGRYMQGFNRSGMDWRHFRPDAYSLRKSRMMIRVAHHASSPTTQISSNPPQTCSLSTNRHSGIQLIHPQPGFREPFEVFCDQEYEGGGWVVIQNRYEGSVHFYRGWNDYERGFGSLNGEFWLGLSKIHELTYSRRYELHVLLEDWEGIRAVARYDNFLVAGPEEKYMLRSLGTFSGNAGDSLSELSSRNEVQHF